MSSDDLTHDGERHVNAWLQAREAARQAQERYWQANRDLEAAEEALAAWLKPSDAKPGEKIAVWYTDKLVQLEVGGVVTEAASDSFAAHTTRDKITLRPRGKAK
jgi:hypothetical protein